MLAVALCCASLFGVELSPISERSDSFFQLGAATSSGDEPMNGLVVKQDEDRTLKNLRVVTSGSQEMAASSGSYASGSTKESGSLEAAIMDATSSTDTGHGDHVPASRVTNASSALNSSTSSEASGSTEQSVGLDEHNQASGEQEATNEPAQSGAADASEQDTTLDEQASAAGDFETGNSTAHSEGSALNNVVAANSPDEEGNQGEPPAEINEAVIQQQPTDYDLDELMTPELIEQIESQEIDYLDPAHVHLLWIGDINKAPRSRHKYSDMGYNLTVHTSAEEVLEGFHPYVLEAFKLAVPNVVGFDFLKFAMLYKFGGFAVDADTTPAIKASQLQWPADCDVVFGKELKNTKWTKPAFLDKPHGAYAMNRPFQILNWAMAVNKPRNPHIKQLLTGAMMHFFGRRDMEQSLIQDISGSGLMSDYVALLHEREGRSFPDVYRDESKYVPVQGMCLTDGYLYGKWIRHAFLNSWRQAGAH